MSAVVYLKVTSGIDTTISLVCSKTKVAPLKSVTIPRLELTAATLLARLSRYVSTTLNLTTCPVYLWTDSNVALTWILSHPSRWKDFVRNRVSLIQELLPQAKWMFISGKENPADCASRGLTAQKLSKHDLWWQGPSWLTKTSDLWPHPSPPINLNLDLEERPGLSLAVTQSPPKLWDLCKRYSSLNRLLRITAICQRIASLAKHLPKSSLSFPLSVSDLETARKFWIQSTQATYFSDSIKLLSKDSFYLNLILYLDLLRSLITLESFELVDDSKTLNLVLTQSILSFSLSTVLYQIFWLQILIWRHSMGELRSLSLTYANLIGSSVDELQFDLTSSNVWNAPDIEANVHSNSWVNFQLLE